MNKKKVLIITHSQDNSSVDAVITCIRAVGAEAIRFNADRYPMEYMLSTFYKENHWSVFLDTGDAVHDLEKVTAIWFRRSYNIGKGLEQTLEREFVSPAMGEIQRTFFGMLEGMPCFKMERYSTYRRLDSKEEQLRKAAKLGLRIPPTCISNDPGFVKNFVEQLDEPVITKMQSAFSIMRGQEEHVMFTNEISNDHLQELDALRYCPMTFQQKIEKKLELRVTIVGREIFAFSIDSQKNAEAQIDWRKEGRTLLDDWKPYELPQMIQSKLLAYMDDYQLNYGAIDMILTPENDLYFLEINAAGEYFWLDKLCNNAISQQIAAVLLGIVPRRERS
jgi:hypothetical protein